VGRTSGRTSSVRRGHRGARLGRLVPRTAAACPSGTSGRHCLFAATGATTLRLASQRRLQEGAYPWGARPPDPHDTKGSACSAARIGRGCATREAARPRPGVLRRRRAPNRPSGIFAAARLLARVRYARCAPLPCAFVSPHMLRYGPFGRCACWGRVLPGVCRGGRFGSALVRWLVCSWRVWSALVACGAAGARLVPVVRRRVRPAHARQFVAVGTLRRVWLVRLAVGPRRCGGLWRGGRPAGAFLAVAHLTGPASRLAPFFVAHQLVPRQIGPVMARPAIPRGMGQVSAWVARPRAARVAAAGSPPPGSARRKTSSPRSRPAVRRRPGTRPQLEVVAPPARHRPARAVVVLVRHSYPGFYHKPCMVCLSVV